MLPISISQKIDTEPGHAQAAEGETVPSMIVVRRVDIRRIEVEVVRSGISSRSIVSSGRRPVVAVLACDIQAADIESDVPAAHKTQIKTCISQHD